MIDKHDIFFGIFLLAVFIAIAGLYFKDQYIANDVTHLQSQLKDLNQSYFNLANFTVGLWYRMHNLEIAFNGTYYDCVGGYLNSSYQQGNLTYNVSACSKAYVAKNFSSQ